MNIPKLPFVIPELPRHVLISVIVIGVSIVSFGVLLLTLASARNDAVALNERLNGEIRQKTTNLTQSKADIAFVTENSQKFEELLESGRLVPHTRATAIRRMQEAALQRGLTTLNYGFAAASERSAAAVTSQPSSGGYRVNVESIKLTIGAPLDGKIYGFLADISSDFPGAAVTQTVQLERVPMLTDDLLKQLGSEGGVSLVKGEVTLLWRTAQANETNPGDKKP